MIIMRLNVIAESCHVIDLLSLCHLVQSSAVHDVYFGISFRLVVEFGVGLVTADKQPLPLSATHHHHDITADSPGTRNSISLLTSNITLAIRLTIKCHSAL